ncbi:hypothetical protein HCU01_21520 [Halomonas cupida]|uniref:DNA-binding protein n=1 Tax=Halomonas cupida TaxID=44933 RepID=A0A1M7IVF9_9GAMM|nr:hypothetical protein [Halomonas cupida]GEN24203.1 hypothetical protein HCU01_21520 [Halomonas cupida]SHM44679.1 hypothetical protein SAMN05660971_02996 [Halomonas cupida]
MATRTTKSTKTTEAATPDITQIKAEALVERIKSSNPKFLGNMSDQRAANLVRYTLRALAAEINETEEGRLRVAGLGGVAIRQVEREKDGTTEKVKRVILRPAQPKT